MRVRSIRKRVEGRPADVLGAKAEKRITFGAMNTGGNREGSGESEETVADRQCSNPAPQTPRGRTENIKNST